MASKNTNPFCRRGLRHRDLAMASKNRLRPSKGRLSKDVPGRSKTSQRLPRAFHDLPRPSTGVPPPSEDFHLPPKTFHRPSETSQRRPRTPKPDKVLQGCPTHPLVFQDAHIPPPTLSVFVQTPSAFQGFPKSPEALKGLQQPSKGLPRASRDCHHSFQRSERTPKRIGMSCVPGLALRNVAERVARARGAVV